MTRRIVVTITAIAALAGGAGVASAATGSAPPAGMQVTSPSSQEHQFCVLIWRDNNPKPQHICVNW
jgi:hypothetical protein